MRVHHRIPSIFSLSMVDVLCCALGCVILLWLLNLREAKHHQDEAEVQAEETTSLLKSTEARATQTASLLKSTEAERDDAFRYLLDLQDHIDKLEKNKSEVENKLYAQKASMKELDEQIRDALARIALLQGKLKTSETEAVDARGKSTTLATQLAAALSRIKDLEGQAGLIPGLKKDIKTLEGQALAAQTTVKDYEKELAKRKEELEQTMKSLELALATRKKLEGDLTTTATQLTRRGEELAEARAYKDKWLTSERNLLLLQERLGDREKKLAAAIAALNNSQIATKTLQSQVTRLQSATVNRFAGITLTGRNVVFLVDRSGSMLESAEKVPAPTKWVEVRNTVARLMRSLPDLERFQLVVFGADVRLPLGSPGKWIPYDPETSPDQVIRALADPSLKPEGGTNMYAGLEAAFSLRDQGLDAVYLLSDGLPSLGPGVAPNVAPTLSEIKLGEVLGQHIRQKLRTEWNPRKADQSRVRISSIGFFYESPDVGAFLWALSRENDGSFVGMNQP